MDRLATLYVFHPLAERLVSHEVRIPILMYHSISDASDDRHPYYQTTTSPARFAEQMRFLKENGYRAEPLSQAVKTLARNESGIPKPVVVTFDDGYRDFYTNAYPVLAEHGFSATMFLPTGYIGDRRLSFNNLECLTWSEVRELHGAGMEFGSHTVTHPKLKELGPEAVEEELRCSKAAIEDQLGGEAACFSYPFAFPETMRPFVGKLRETLLTCGYRHGVSTMIGSATTGDDPLFLRRLPVNVSDDLRLFRAKLEGGYEWLYRFQRLKKSVGTVVAR
jgi:peptidoglycan/xylan/chitin deacetylase (PgdA/CDA1 family)